MQLEIVQMKGRDSCKKSVYSVRGTPPSHANQMPRDWNSSLTGLSLMSAVCATWLATPPDLRTELNDDALHCHWCSVSIGLATLRKVGQPKNDRRPR